LHSVSSQNPVIRSHGAYVPERRVSNDELAQIVDTSDEWIYSHTGIRYRHIAAEHEAASDLALRASSRALEAAGIPADELDLILLATSTPDYPGLPSTACIVQHKLGASNAAAMDIVAACTGYVYSIETARAFVKAGSARNVLVVGSEVYSRILDWTDRSTCVLFGDGAAASVVSADGSGGEIVDSLLYSDGSGATSLYRPAGGSRQSHIPNNEEHLGCLKMDGRRIYNFAVRVIGSVTHQLLERNDLAICEVSYIVPHQANRRIIDAAARRNGLPQEIFYMNLDEYANTSAASIPLALCEMEKKGLLEPGTNVITLGFGAGLTYGANLIRY